MKHVAICRVLISHASSAEIPKEQSCGWSSCPCREKRLQSEIKIYSDSYLCVSMREIEMERMNKRLSIDNFLAQREHSR